MRILRMPGTVQDGDGRMKKNRRPRQTDMEVWYGLPDSEKSEFGRKCFEKYRKKLLEGRIDESRFDIECGFGPENNRRIAEMYLKGDGVERDPHEYLAHMFQAYRFGDREAAWEILEFPEYEGESLGIGSYRTLTAYILGTRYGRWIPAFLREAEERSAEHPEMAAAVVSARAMGADPCPAFIPLAGGSFAKDVLYWGAVSELDGGNGETGMRLLEEAADRGSDDALFEMGRRLFTGRGIARDPAASLDHFLRAAEDGDRRARYWLALFMPVTGGDVPAGEGVHAPRDHGRSVRPYHLPPGQLEEASEWYVLLDLCGLDTYGCSLDRFSETDGFENSVFSIRPYLWWEPGDKEWETASVMPNFLFKPTGFEIEWYRYPFKDSWMNRPLTLGQVRHIWRLCIQSVLDHIDEGERR